jgi:serine/threonine protein kinase/TPR repeat protein
MGDFRPHDNEHYSSNPSSLGKLVDRLCDEFEDKWRGGQRPEIEDSLYQAPVNQQLDMFAHLLDIELFWRRKAREVPTPDEYRLRFPNFAEVIEQHFTSGGSDESVPNANQETFLLTPSKPLPSEAVSARSFGNYELLREIGRGGMGIVYQAWQPSANRFVALKLIRRDRLEALPRAHQSGVIHRFQHEAQAAGHIEHDHIVTVYEVGEIEGEHFFSMRYVEGQSLGDIFRDGPLDGERAARYLEPVARAVHEAHLHGILHRDLKPQNILVDAKTDRALVVDFGLAKLAEGAEEMTQAGDVMGTPAYMPPEQAEDSSRVTAKSDVYALGATLYHAITGHPPFAAGSPLEMIRKVAEETPPAIRTTNPNIHRDLETICLKCLEKEPARRYASAEALADELLRFLNREPIEARPISSFARGIRWCHRNPVIAGLICCTIVFFAAALVSGLVGYAQTRMALSESERHYQTAHELLNRFYTRVSEESLLNQPGMQPLRRDLLQQALVYYEQFLKERVDDPTIQDELSTTAYRVGRITELLETVKAAEPWYHRALKMQEQIAAQHPEHFANRVALGDTLNALGGVELAQGRLKDAEEYYERAVEVRRQLTSATPAGFDLQRTLANTIMNLGVISRDKGNIQRAEERFLSAQELRREILDSRPDDLETRRDLAKGSFNLADLCRSKDPPDDEGAKEFFGEALSLFEQLLEAEPNDLANQYRATVTARLLGDLLCRSNDFEQALPHYLRAFELGRQLAYHNPDVPTYQSQLAIVLTNTGELYRGELGVNLDYAESCFAEAKEILERLVDEYPKEAQYAELLMITMWTLAEVKADQGDQETAKAQFEELRTRLKRLVRQFPNHEQFSTLLTESNRESNTVSTHPTADADAP